MKDTPIAQALASLIIEARVQKGLTQQQLAERMGTTQPNLARAESGKTEPSVSFLKRIADTLGISLILPKWQYEELQGWQLSHQLGRDMHSGIFVEVICPHGVGHHKGIHGCHFTDESHTLTCCSNCPPQLWEKVTK
jgi:DNA-binding XRE family transcriptional regulator